jgi:hypothetical protein
MVQSRRAARAELLTEDGEVPAAGSAYSDWLGDGVESSGCQCIVRVGNTRNPNERSRVIVRALLTTKYGLATDERFSWVSGWYLDVAGIVRRK